MQLRSGEKKAIAIIAIVTALFVVVVGATVAALTAGRQHDDRGYLQMAIGKQLHRVEPVRWCDLFLRVCDPPLSQIQRTTPHTPVPIGESVVMSVSKNIAEGPWTLALVYSTPHGIVEDETTQESGSSFTTVINSRADRVLVGITVTPASVIQNGPTSVYPRGVLTVQTAPTGFRLNL
ncbi:MAG: DUF2771 family protein [Gordonia sp. (in: high G+C Gram-positive bacteria)]